MTPLRVYTKRQESINFASVVSLVQEMAISELEYRGSRLPMCLGPIGNRNDLGIK